MHNEICYTAMANILFGIMTLFINAAAAMPIITLFTMIAACKRDAAFCMWFSWNAIKLDIALSMCSLFCLLFQTGYMLARFVRDGASLSISVIMQRAFLPWTSSILLWCVGIIFLFLALVKCERKLNLAGKDANMTFPAIPAILCALGATIFFSTFITINWPFAGLPPGMDLPQAVAAICRNGLHRYFSGFTPAGACLLASWQFFVKTSKNDISPEQSGMAIRWSALWALAGYTPYCIQNWGLSIGIMLQTGIPEFLKWKIYSLLSLTFSLGCWGIILGTGQKLARHLTVPGWIFLILFPSIPDFLRCMSH